MDCIIHTQNRIYVNLYSRYITLLYLLYSGHWAHSFAIWPEFLPIPVRVLIFQPPGKLSNSEVIIIASSSV